MINRLLQSHLEPIARGGGRRQLWRRLAQCWMAAALAGLAGIWIHRLDGGYWPWLFPLILLAALLAAAIILLRFSRTSPDYQALARQIEKENPDLQALLLTAVEQQPHPATGELNYLQQRVISEALEQHAASPWGQRISKQLYAAQRAHGLALAGFVIVLAALLVSSPPAKGLWAGAGRSNGVTVTPGDTSVERGSSLVILARFEGRLPAEAELVLKPVNEPERRTPLTKNLNDPVFGGGIPEVKGDFRYQIDSSNGRTREFKVSVFDYPRLERADAKVTYPAYTGLAEKTIPDTRRVSAVEGSLLDYAFFLNKPVVTAQLVGRDKSVISLTNGTKAGVFHARFTLDQTRHYQLVLVDEAGRTNKVPPEFVLEALKNQPAGLKVAFPRGDQRVSPLEEIHFQAEASDDFGLGSYGIAYALAGGKPTTVELGHGSKPLEKRNFTYLLPLESLGAQPDQLLSYYLWADDVGPDGRTRRTSSDMYFAEIRPFDEIFREGQSPEDNSDQNGQGGGQGNETENLSELQKQVISATWNLLRRETGPQSSDKFKADVTVVKDSQQKALEQLRGLEQRINDPKLKKFTETAEQAMEQAAGHLTKAAGGNSPTPLTPALAAEQSAGQALLNLRARQYQVSRNNRSRRGKGGGQASQRQMDQLDLKQTDNRYETQRQAAPTQTAEQREQLQVSSRLKELAQRQQDINEKLKELQSSLEEAKTAAEREDIQRRLKRLREEQQDLLADVDELHQRMERPENQERMAEARRQLDQTRAEVERAAEALEQQSASQALASGTRAQRDLQQLQDDFRKKGADQFADDMRQMRESARQLAQRQEDIAKKLEGVAEPRQKTLTDSDAQRTEKRELANQMLQQENSLTNLFSEIHRVSEQSEATEPLLSRQLYDLLRQNGQDEANQALSSASELVLRDFLPQAGPFEERARKNIDDIKHGVEHAAESVLGDDTGALRVASRELEELRQKLDEELAQAGVGQGTNAAGRGTNDAERQSASTRKPGSNSNEPSGQTAAERSGNGQNSTAGQPGGQANGSSPSLAGANPPSAGNASPTGAQAGGANQGRGERNGSRSGAAQNRADRGGLDNGGAGGVGGGVWNQGPLVGGDFVDWSDRLRDVEEMIDVPDLRTQVARIRDRARAVRLESRRTGKKPDWAVVKAQISAPLAEVHSQIAEELARRGSRDALVPLDRDPVPAKFSEVVRRYYEQLGKTD